MATIPDEHLDRLRAAGLLVSDPFLAGHVAFPDGIVVGKPKSVPGHCLPDFECLFGANGTPVDAPTLYLHSDGGRWFVTSHDYVPGPGPRDFVDEWNTPEEAVADVLNFYFGDAARMDAKRNR